MNEHACEYAVARLTHVEKPAPPFPSASMNLLPWVHTCTRYTMNEHACEYAVARLPHVDETSLSLFLASINSPPSGHHTDVIHVHAKKTTLQYHILLLV
jgi:hypothetical protein